MRSNAQNHEQNCFLQDLINFNVHLTSISIHQNQNQNAATPIISLDEKKQRESINLL